MSLPVIRVINIGAKVLSIVVTGVLWHVAYKYILKNKDGDKEYEFRNNDDYSDCYKVIRMKIPSYAKGGIIGKSGSTIRRIQDKTKTTIKFLNKNVSNPEILDDKQSDWNVDIDVSKDEDQSLFEVILIRGLTLRAMEAEKEIKAIVASIPVYNEESMTVDNRFVGKIIGKKGENVKRLKECYKVQIDIDRSETSQRKIIFRGTAENIIECRRDIVKTIDAIMKENKYFDSLRLNMVAKECFPKSQYVKYPGGLNEKIYIYVSSVVDCSKFYAHIAGDDLKALSNLSDEMTEYFSIQDKKVLDDATTQTFNVGDIVAGYYAASHTWQRVKIINYTDNLFDIIYLDYGDSASLKESELRTFDRCHQFLELPFQALRLITYGIKPVNDNGWSDGDISHFEKITKVGHCYQIASILKSRDGPNFVVQLIDENSGLDVAQSLISDGIALPMY